MEDGVAFPQEEYLNDQTGAEFFAEQTYTAVAVDSESDKVYDLHILFGIIGVNTLYYKT